MNKKKRIFYIQESLEKLYPNPKILLNHHNEFTFLIAVLLSSQTTDKKVNEITAELFKVADSVVKMEKLSINEIKNFIKKIGLFNIKSKNIFFLTKKLLKEYKGKVPNTFEELELLPGVGHKTASVVISHLFGVPAFPVDTHIYRLMRLWKLSSGKSVQKIEKDAKKIFPIERWNKLHIQMIYYGREYSPARRYNLENDFITRNIFQE